MEPRDYHETSLRDAGKLGGQSNFYSIEIQTKSLVKTNNHRDILDLVIITKRPSGT